MRLPVKKQYIVFSLLTFLVLFIFFILNKFIYESRGDEERDRLGISQTNLDESASSNINKNTAEVPFHPFEKLQRRLVIVLTYQRCGSTFFGKIFNENNDAFYLFEPLDSLYSATYGTKQGWNVPSDITNYANGTKRHLVVEEITHVSNFLKSLLLCDMDNLPTETLVHKFYSKFQSEHISISKYVKCKKPSRMNISNCAELSPTTICGKRFGQKSEEELQDCRKALADPQYRNKHTNKSIFNKYRTCNSELREFIDKTCVASLKSFCSKRNLRAVKLVRGTMDSMESLLESLPNLRIIHLVRDPRAVVLSRKRFDSSARGIYSNLKNSELLSREALLYCNTVVRDVLKRQELELKYPGKIFPIVYDEMAKDIKSYIEKVYAFLGLTVPAEVLSWYKLSSNSTFRKKQDNATIIASKWQNTITYGENKKIEAVCQDFYQLVRFNWAV